MRINQACELSKTNFSLTFGPFQVLSAGGRGVPLRPRAVFAQGTVCFVILNVTLVKLCTAGEINSKVDFDAIKLYFFVKKLAVCSFLL